MRRVVSVGLAPVGLAPDLGKVKVVPRHKPGVGEMLAGGRGGAWAGVRE